MTDFDLARLRHTIDHLNPPGMWNLAHRLATDIAEQRAQNELQQRTINLLRKGNATVERTVAGLTHKGGGHTPVLDLAITPDAPTDDATEMREISTALLDDYDRIEAALSVVVAIVDRAHLHDGGPGGGAPAPGTGCLPECRMCAELASIPKPLLDTARAINARTH